jgi:hypothetical protein
MSAEDYKLYQFIEFHVKNDNQSADSVLDEVIKPERRSGKDRRKHRFIKAKIKVKVDSTDGAEITASGGTVTATKCKDGAAIQATGAVIKKE